MRLQMLISLLFIHISSLCAQDVDLKVIKVEAATSEQILENEDVSVRVQGFVEATRINATGIHFLDFKGSDFICVTFAGFVEKFPDGPPAEFYKEKWVEVTGKIQNYRGTPQIRLESPDQVKILDQPSPPPPAPPQVTEAAKEPETKAAIPAPKEKPATPNLPPTRELEVINGVPALDWRKYFPESSSR
jgi:hypothetical protein